MFTPDMFNDKVHPVHFVGVRKDGSIVQGDIRVTEKDLCFVELLASIPCPTSDVKMWFDGQVWQERYIHS